MTVLLTSNFDIFNFSTKGTTSPTTTSVAAPATLASLHSHHLCDFSSSYPWGYSLQPVPTISSTLPTDTFLGSLPTTLPTDTALVLSVSLVLPTNTLLALLPTVQPTNRSLCPTISSALPTELCLPFCLQLCRRIHL